MGLGKSTGGAQRKAIFVDLKFNATKGADGVGFRETTSKTPRTNPQPGEAKYDYTYEMHNFVEGEIKNFSIREEPSYEDENVKEMIGYITVRDVAVSDGGEAAPDVVVKFPMFGSAGRRLVGLVAAAQEKAAGAIYIYTNFAEAGQKLGDKTLTKPQAYINAKVGDARGEKLSPLYYDGEGKPYLDQNGKPAQLPMGEQAVINRKTVWNFEKADDWVASTAVVVATRFQAEHESQAQGAGEPDQAHAGDEEIDLGEASRAAMGG